MGEADPPLAAGEVVFNTAMTGYQEILTDPSYYGQIVVLTYPLIGNYGTLPEAAESLLPWARALVVHDLEGLPSHAGDPWALEAYLGAYGKLALTGVDTRALTRHLRVVGTLLGAVAEAGADPRAIQAALAGVDLKDSVYRVSTPRPYTLRPQGAGNGLRVAVMDYGVKSSILHELLGRGVEVTVLPAATPPAELDRLAPDGVVLSNGPGDPADVPELLELVRHSLERYPTFGICLGHQLVALAEGARTYRLKFGHHGANHPLLDHRRQRVVITAQNHGYAVDPEALGNRYTIRLTNLHDRTVEGLAHRERPVLTAQHHPEAGPGPKDSLYLFDEFLELVRAARRKGGDAGAQAR
ncbi:MAG: glutamine-hydrolyzing carbamoyl-phosphate synthase small subunit [Firmicutes bacterium]|nr:glutamine-hydrolyzing carbamoyl-phosphate synthase small subunit [Bacillota bacterium]